MLHSYTRRSHNENLTRTHRHPLGVVGVSLSLPLCVFRILEAYEFECLNDSKRSDFCSSFLFILNYFHPRPVRSCRASRILIVRDVFARKVMGPRKNQSVRPGVYVGLNFTGRIIRVRKDPRRFAFRQSRVKSEPSNFTSV